MWKNKPQKASQWYINRSSENYCTKTEEILRHDAEKICKFQPLV